MNVATQSLQSQSEKPIAESHHIDISTDGYNDAHSNMSTDGHINFAKDLMKKLKILTQTYLLMDILMLLNVNIKLYSLMRI